MTGCQRPGADGNAKVGKLEVQLPADKGMLFDGQPAGSYVIVSVGFCRHQACRRRGFDESDTRPLFVYLYCTMYPTV